MSRPNSHTQTRDALEAEISRIRSLDKDDLRILWLKTFKAPAPQMLPKDLLGRAIAYHLQEKAYGGLDTATTRLLERHARGDMSTIPQRHLKSGTVLVRDYQGKRHTVTVAKNGFLWNETAYPSLSAVAKAITGTKWNGHRFFGLRGSEHIINAQAYKLQETAS